MAEPVDTSSGVSCESCAPGCLVTWLTALVRGERPHLVAIARGEGLADAEALDAVQDGWITFLGRPETTDLAAREATADAAHLLAAITRNAARNARRRHHRARPHDGEIDAVVDDDQDPAARVVAAEQRLALSTCVAELGDDARRIVLMRLLDELSGDDVAAVLGTTPGNVAVMLHRAKAKLRECLLGAGVTPA